MSGAQRETIKGAQAERSPVYHGGKPFFTWPVRVYYQHTDAGGVVFHGDYLNFMEAARAEMLRAMGFDVGELARRDGVLFVVHTLQLRYLRPARLGDSLEVVVKVVKALGARLVLEQFVRRGEETLVSAQLTLACVNALDQRPIAIPKPIKEAFGREKAEKGQELNDVRVVRQRAPVR